MQLGDAGARIETAELTAETLLHGEEFETAARMLGTATLVCIVFLVLGHARNRK